MQRRQFDVTFCVSGEKTMTLYADNEESARQQAANWTCGNIISGDNVEDVAADVDVFGFGLNSVRNQDAALRVCRLLLTRDGWLILGWNTDRCANPSELSGLRNHFRPSSFLGLPQRKTFTNSTHVYGTFTAVEVE
jgi:hypothetical protein